MRPDRPPVCIEKHSHGPEKEKIEWGRKVKLTVSHATDTGNEVQEPEFEELTHLRKVRFLPRQPNFESE